MWEMMIIGVNIIQTIIMWLQSHISKRNKKELCQVQIISMEYKNLKSMTHLLSQLLTKKKVNIICHIISVLFCKCIIIYIIIDYMLLFVAIIKMITVTQLLIRGKYSTHLSIWVCVSERNLNTCQWCVGQPGGRKSLCQMFKRHTDLRDKDRRVWRFVQS